MTPAPRGDPRAGEGGAGRDRVAAKRRLLESMVAMAAGTQEALAQELDISYATLHAWRTGRRSVPDDALRDMARIALVHAEALRNTAVGFIREADLSGDMPEPEGGKLSPAGMEARARARLMREETIRMRERLRRRSSTPLHQE